MAGVRFENVSKVFDKSVVAVDSFNLEIRDKEFVVFVGPSGCGKSTTLRMIAGLEAPTTGNIYIGDRLVNDITPKDRDIAMVFQNYALYPHMTVYENIAYGLRLRKYPKSVIDQKVKEAAQSLAITELLKRKPKALSGGQRQRVAIGRAIVREPQVFLMDEPLSNLDAKLRNQMRAEILTLRRKLDTSTWAMGEPTANWVICMGFCLGAGHCPLPPSQTKLAQQSCPCFPPLWVGQAGSWLCDDLGPRRSWGLGM